MRPFLAVYSTFYQRCYDQMLHDVCMQHLPVVFLLDRSGVGAEDGQTHHGLFDLTTALPIPGLTVLAPSSSDELISMMKWTLTQNNPCIIRYPKSLGRNPDNISNKSFVPGKWNALNEQNSIVLLAVGSMVSRAAEVHQILKKQRIPSTVVNCSSLKPLDESYLANLSNDTYLFTLEEHMLIGGFGQYISRFCFDHGYRVPVRCFGVKDVFIQHGDHDHLMNDAGLNTEYIAEEIYRFLKGEHFFDRKDEG